MSDKINKLRVRSYDDREKVLVALANSGYKVWVEEEKHGVFDSEYFVCYEESPGK